MFSPEDAVQQCAAPHLSSADSALRDQLVASIECSFSQFGFSGIIRLIGSHAKHTAIAPLRDIDVCALFAFSKQLRPQQLLQKTARLCSLTFPNYDIEHIAHAIRVHHGNLTIDVVPAYKQDGKYHVAEWYPNTLPTWTITDFDAQAMKLQELCARYGDQVLHDIHMMKYWRDRHRPEWKSYHLETWVIAHWKTHHLTWRKTHFAVL